MFFGTRNLTESLKIARQTGSPDFYSSVAKKGVFFIFSLNYIITFLPIGLET